MKRILVVVSLIGSGLLFNQLCAQPNVIYLLFDDLGYGDLSCYGQDKLQTPNIDRIAEQGMRFTQHYSGNTVCSPSRATLMTGQHPGHCYLRGNLAGELGAELDPAMTALPELFRNAGYATGAFGKWGLGHSNAEGAPSPLTHGFDEFYGWKSQVIAHTYYPKTMVHNGKEMPVEPGIYVHDLVVGHAFEFIRQKAGTHTPFFCYMTIAVPHAAMQAPAGLHMKWRLRLPQFDEKIGKYGAGPDEPCPDVINPVAGFAAMLENVDNQVGELLEMLSELDIAENTLILVSSDNGAHKEGGHDPWYWDSNGPLRGHKRDLYEGGIRAPFLACWPGTIPAGSESDHISAFWDVLPTMADLLDQPVPEQVDGISFLPTLIGDPGNQMVPEYMYWEFCKGAEQVVWSQAVRMGDWKAVKVTGKPKEGVIPAIELYNLAKDLGEEHDLAAQHPKLVKKAEKIMEKARIPVDQAR